MFLSRAGNLPAGKIRRAQRTRHDDRERARDRQRRAAPARDRRASRRTRFTAQAARVNNSSPKMIRAVIFDLDGTLVDTEPLHFAAFNEVLRPEGIEIPLDE